MEITEAIKKAIEGGYLKDFKSVRGTDLFFADGNLWLRGTDGSEVCRTNEEIFLDPLFWQALGKAMGWIDKDYPNGEMRCTHGATCLTRYCPYAGFKNPVEEWHRFIDTLAEGKTPEDYFLTLP